MDEALASTALAARTYGRPGRSGERSVLSLEAALTVLTAVTKILVLAASRRRHVDALSFQGLPK
jgi:hypothetical protein